MTEPTKYVLGEDAIPTHWVNLLPDLPGEPLPPLNPQTGPDKVRPGRGPPPDPLVHPPPRPARRAAAAAEPADRPAGRAGRPHADLPDGADHAGGLARAGDRHPGRGPRRLPAVAPDAA